MKYSHLKSKEETHREFAYPCQSHTFPYGGQESGRKTISVSIDISVTNISASLPRVNRYDEINSSGPSLHCNGCGIKPLKKGEAMRM
jgi:hypothetical protein